MSKIKNSGLDQYGAEPFNQQQFGTSGVKGVKYPQQSTIVEQCDDWCIEPLRRAVTLGRAKRNFDERVSNPVCYLYQM